MKAFLFGVTLCFMLLHTGLYAQYSVREVIPASGGDCNGAVTIDVDPMGEPHTYLWSNGSTTQNIAQLCPGIYSVTITATQGCEWVLQAEVDGIDGCYLPNMIINADIEPYCGAQSLGSITLLIPNPTQYIYKWSNGVVNTHVLPDLNIGTYCVDILSQNGTCFTSRCYDVTDEGCGGGGGGTSTGMLMVNEVSNGATEGEQEFVELVVVGGDDCEYVNIGGYIVDDNDGTFTAGSGGSGVSPGHIRFSTSEIWSSVKRGSIILIYNNNDKNPRITLPDDPYDSDQNNVYIIPADHIVLETYYGSGNYVSGGDWTTVALYNNADAMQVRSPSNDYEHGISYGIPALINGGPDGLHLWQMNGTDRTYCFDNGDYRNIDDWTVGTASHGHESPGYPNNPQNQAFINSLCIGDSKMPGFGGTGINPIYEEKGYAQFSPNPFNDYLNIELEWSSNEEVELRVYDLLGRVVLAEPLILQEGRNQHTLKFAAGFSSGLYQVAICKEEEILIKQKVICTRSIE